MKLLRALFIAGIFLSSLVIRHSLSEPIRGEEHVVTSEPTYGFDRWNFLEDINAKEGRYPEFSKAIGDIYQDEVKKDRLEQLKSDDPNLEKTLKELGLPHPSDVLGKDQKQGLEILQTFTDDQARQLSLSPTLPDVSVDVAASQVKQVLELKGIEKDKWQLLTDDQLKSVGDFLVDKPKATPAEIYKAIYDSTTVVVSEKETFFDSQRAALGEDLADQLEREMTPEQLASLTTFSPEMLEYIKSKLSADQLLGLSEYKLMAMVPMDVEQLKVFVPKRMDLLNHQESIFFANFAADQLAQLKTSELTTMLKNFQKLLVLLPEEGVQFENVGIIPSPFFIKYMVKVGGFSADAFARLSSSDLVNMMSQLKIFDGKTHQQIANSLIEILPEDPGQRLQALMGLYNESITNLPSDTQASVRNAIADQARPLIISNIGDVLTREVRDETVGSTRDTYRDELQIFKNFLDFVEPLKLEVGDPLYSSELDVAKRILKLRAFTDATASWGDWFKSLPEKVRTSLSDRAQTIVKNGDPGFQKQLDSLKKSFKADGLTAMPEDLFALQQSRLNGIIDALSQSPKPGVDGQKIQAEQLEKLNAILRDLYDKRYKLDDKLVALSDLLMDEDKIKLTDFNNRFSKQFVPIFEEHIKSYVGSGDTLPALDVRVQAVRELRQVYDLFKTYFADDMNAKALVDRIDGIFDKTRKMDEATEEKITSDVSSLLKTSAADFIDPNKRSILDKKLDDQLKTLYFLQGGMSFAGDASKTAAFNDVLKLQAVKEIGLFAKTVDSRDIRKIADAFSTSYENVRYEFLDYNKVPFDGKNIRSSFDVRKDVMNQQSDVLKTMSEVLNKVEGLDDLATSMSDVMLGKEIDADRINLLKGRKYLDENGMVTDAGLDFAQLAEDNLSIARRLDQLNSFSSKAPSLTVKSRAGRVIPLAKDLKLTWLIPDDQIRALEQTFVNTGQNQIVQRIFADFNNPQPVYSTESRMQLLVTAFSDPEMIKSLGLEVSTDPQKIIQRLNDEKILLQGLGIAITPDDPKYTQLLAEKLLAKEAGLQQKTRDQLLPVLKDMLSDPAVRLELLQRTLLAQEYFKQMQAGQDPKQSALNRLKNQQRLIDLSDLLELQPDVGSEYVKVLVDIQLKKLPGSDDIFSQHVFSVAIGDAQESLLTDPKSDFTTWQNIKYKVMLGFDVVVDKLRQGLEVMGLLTQKGVMKTGQVTGTAIEVSSIPAGLVIGYLTRQIAKNPAATTVATLGAGGLGALVGAVTMGPIGSITGAFAGAKLGYEHTQDVAQLLATIASGYTLYKVGGLFRPSDEAISKFNEKANRKGVAEIGVDANDTLIQDMYKAVSSAFTSSVKQWSNETGTAQLLVDKKQKLADQSRLELQKFLGFSETEAVSPSQLEEAFNRKVAQILASMKTGMQPETRRINGVDIKKTGFDWALNDRRTLEQIKRTMNRYQKQLVDARVDQLKKEMKVTLQILKIAPDKAEQWRITKFGKKAFDWAFGKKQGGVDPKVILGEDNYQGFIDLRDQSLQQLDATVQNLKKVREQIGAQDSAFFVDPNYLKLYDLISSTYVDALGDAAVESMQAVVDVWLGKMKPDQALGMTS